MRGHSRPLTMELIASVSSDLPEPGADASNMNPGTWPLIAGLQAIDMAAAIGPRRASLDANGKSANGYIRRLNAACASSSVGRSGAFGYSRDGAYRSPVAA